MRLWIRLFTAAVLTHGATAADPVPDPSAAARTAASQKLAETGIEPTVAGVTAYLASQIPNTGAKREAAKWINDLRSPDFLVRERAEISLLATANPPVEALEAAAADLSDPETALRAERILRRVQTRPRTTLHTALRWVESTPDRAFLSPLLSLIEWAKTSVERSLIHRALAASASPDDFPLLARAAAHALPPVRLAAAAGLAALPGSAAADTLADLSADPDESVRLAAAAALAHRGDRRCLAPLGDLLSSETTATRMRAHHLLGTVTGKKFDFSPYASAEDRATAAEKILRWIGSEGATSTLLERPDESRESPYIGRTVVGHWPDQFQHYDSDGALLFSVPGYKYVWGCHATADGQFAVVDAKDKTARIYDADGNALWTKADLPGEPSDIKILENGNRLITLSTPARIIEFDPENTIVWQVDFPGRTRSTTADRLPNGNTLVNLQFGKKVVEVNPEGETVWELAGLKNCLTAQALPGGNVLVCEMNDAKALEYNREGEIVWEKGGFKNACQAQRLPGGNTLVSDEDGIHEIDPEGNEISKIPVKRGRFWRY